jgi:hypothetical protein
MSFIRVGQTILNPDEVFAIIIVEDRSTQEMAVLVRTIHPGKDRKVPVGSDSEREALDAIRENFLQVCPNAYINPIHTLMLHPNLEGDGLVIVPSNPSVSKLFATNDQATQEYLASHLCSE